MRNVKAYLSTKENMRMLSPKEDVRFQPDNETEKEIINIYPDVKYQKVLGFGGAFTETSAYNYAKLSPQNQRKIIEAYFDPVKGMGYNFCRTHIHSCDFSLDEYTYTEDDDTALETFSIDRDRKYIIPFIKAAQKTAGDELILFGSPWSPPPWMKDNKEFANGGKLDWQYAACWAAYMARYVTEYRKEGIELFGLTVQNEAMAIQTWESCQYTAEEEGLFVRDHLKPALEKAGLDTRVMIWDHNKERVYDRSRDSFKLEGVKDSVWGIAFHWYSGNHYKALEMAYEAFPDKPLVLSEYCIGTTRGEPIPGPHSSWIGVEMVAEEMIGNLNHGMAAAVDWNLVIDQDGGPFHNRDLGCKSPIVADTKNDTVSLEPYYYSIAHFSKFIKRGAVRIGCSTFDVRIPAVACVNPDGNVVMVALNTMDSAAPVYVRLDDCTAKMELPPKSLVTFVIS